MPHRLAPAAALAAVAAVALAPAAWADAHSAPAIADATELQYGQIYRATSLLGQPIHVTEEEMEMGAALPAGTSDEWERIGEIGDLLIGVDGTLQGVVVDVGGFLGLGEKEVAVNWSALRPVFEEDNADDWLLTLPVTREELEAAAALERVPAE